ncbi:MAG: hypothetical protein OEV94_03825 [Deltaproteobacteria bacterium]|nr:hypothetical protein [Deltaproteobacteria bacterium]
MRGKKEKKGELIGIRVPARMKTALETLAAQEDRTLSHLTYRILLKHLQDHHPGLMVENPKDVL